MVIEVQVKAPGKAILHGEHTVVYGTKAIGIAVGLYTTSSVTKQSTPHVHISFCQVGLDQKLPLEDLRQLKNSLGNTFRFSVLDKPSGIKSDSSTSKLLEDYIACIGGFTGELRSAVEAVFKAFLFIYLATFDELEPIRISVETQLPVGAGLGSSASFAVALAGSLLIASGRTLQNMINTDMVNRWAFLSEKFVHGNPSGIDNTVATLGGAVQYQKNQPLVPLKCSDVRVLIVSTEVPRSTKELVARVAKLKEEDRNLHQKYMEEANELVENAVQELCSTGRIKSEFVEQNQVLLQKLNVSHPRLDLIVDTAKKNNLAAKLTGAGGGGCAFVVIPPNCTTEIVEKLQADLKAECEHFKFWSVPLGVTGISATLL